MGGILPPEYNKTGQKSCIEGILIFPNPKRHVGKVSEKVAAQAIIILGHSIKVAAMRTSFLYVTLLPEQLNHQYLLISD